MMIRLADGDLNIMAELTVDAVATFDPDQVKYLIIDPIANEPDWHNRITLECRRTGVSS